MGLTRNGIRSFKWFQSEGPRSGLVPWGRPSRPPASRHRQQFVVAGGGKPRPYGTPLREASLGVPHRFLLCLLGRRDEFGVLQHLLQERGRIAGRGLLHVSSFVSSDLD